jgi:hypothetical protein
MRTIQDLEEQVMNKNLHTHVYDYAINMVYVVTGYTNYSTMLINIFTQIGKTTIMLHKLCCNFYD